MGILSLDVVPTYVAIAACVFAAWARFTPVNSATPAASVPTWGIVLSIGLALATFLYGKLPHWKLRSLPGPPPTWLLGNLPDVRKENGIPETLTNWKRAYGDMYKFYFGTRLLVVVTDVALVKEVTLKKFRIFHDRSYVSLCLHTARGLSRYMLKHKAYKAIFPYASTRAYSQLRVKYAPFTALA